ncbi:Maph7 [Matsumuraeses phaseoli granulovirus]|uniref:Maph7 n=1 Tax=Matsumuraeses phaseoli granulovirus TaxID=2760664 RepID=A0AAE7SY32_9BBAC|nr:Maph7 [Matsumuraeses phaseoli granulovirus]QOD39970.1 Maph7 [Matsumuraeses phaseoli granulovirus]
MFQIGRACSMDEADIIFQVPNTINSVIQYSYKLINDPIISKTQLVSGLDANKPINCVFSQTADFKSSSTEAYVMSLFRSNQLLPDVLTRAKLNIIKVATKRYTEYWYVLGVKKGYELPAAIPYNKLIVQNIDYPKIKCLISGSVPADLMRALNCKITNKIYLHGLCITGPPAEINTCLVRLIHDSNSNARSM